MFPALLLSAVLMGAAVINSDDASYIRLESTDTTIEAGERFAIDVYAYAHVPVNAVDITLEFDETAVEVLGVDKGQSVLTIWTEEPTVENGSVTLSGGTFRRGFLSEHLIARINLQAVETGQSIFSVSDVVLLAGDGQGTEVSVANPDPKVSFFIYDENTDPSSIEAAVHISIVTDIDNDGKVSLKDISAFMAAWHNKSMVYDFNNDGRMTFRDFSIILADFFFE